MKSSITLPFSAEEITVPGAVSLTTTPLENPEFCRGWSISSSGVELAPESKWGGSKSVFMSARWADMKNPRDVGQLGLLFAHVEVVFTGRLVIEARGTESYRSGYLVDWEVVQAKPVEAPPLRPGQRPSRHGRSGSRPVVLDRAKLTALAEDFLRFRQAEADRKAAEEARRAAWRAACPPPADLLDRRRAAIRSCSAQNGQDMLWGVFDYPRGDLPPLARAWQYVAQAMFLVWGEVGTGDTHHPGANEAHTVRNALKYGERKTLEKMGLPVDGPLWSADADYHGGSCGFQD